MAALRLAAGSDAAEDDGAGSLGAVLATGSGGAATTEYELFAAAPELPGSVLPPPPQAVSVTMTIGSTNWPMRE